MAAVTVAAIVAVAGLARAPASTQRGVSVIGARPALTGLPRARVLASDAEREADARFAAFVRAQRKNRESAEANQLGADEDPAYPPSARQADAPPMAVPIDPPAQQQPSRAVRVGVAALVRSADYPGCILLNRRRGKGGSEALGAGAYGLPGGHLEYGEQFAQCVARELREEAGVEVDPARVRFGHATNAVAAELRTRGSALGDAALDDGEYHYVCIFMTCDLPAGQCPRDLEPERSAGWEWHRWAEMPAPLDARLAQLVAEAPGVGFDPLRAHHED